MLLQELLLHLRALSVLRSATDTRSVRLWKDTLSSLSADVGAFAEAYGALCQNQYDDHSCEIWDAVRFDTNALTERLADAPAELLDAATHDLVTLNALTRLSAEDIKRAARAAFPQEATLLSGLPSFAVNRPLPCLTGEALQEYYLANGFGPFAAASFFSLGAVGGIVPAVHPDRITLADLPGYTLQKEKILMNTRAFLARQDANNILLYGDKGTGKSSTVKAIVNEFAADGLKLLELSPRQITAFPDICQAILRSPFRFIVFLDDLSFDREDDNFAALKAFIEGGVAGKPENMLLYATSNRRHLVRESFAERQGDDIHVRDSLETVTSLSDRFGLEITFSVPDKDEYLFIIDTLSEESGLRIGKPELHLFAERFALRRNGRSPRVARQCIRQLMAEQLAK